MAQAVSRWPVNVEGMVRTQVGFLVDKVALGQILRISPISMTAPDLYTYISSGR
jgi:hypothetical protein